MFGNMFRRPAAFAVAVTGALLFAARTGSGAAVAVPEPTLDASRAAERGEQVAVFSGGCFWGIQAVFQHMKGVTSAVSGYAGGQANTSTYEQVSEGTTGHAESVRVTFDSSQVSYGQLLQVFFSVAHDPTQLDYQGPDHGTQYRSEIWYTTPQQKAIAEAYIAQLTGAKTFRRPIVTLVAPLAAFFPAEAYHQDYATINPHAPYIMINDAPKVANLKKQFPDVYRETPVLVSARR